MFEKKVVRDQFQKLIVLGAFVVFAAPAFASYGVGQREFTFNDTPRARNLKTFVWYPVDSKLKTSPIEELGPFLPVMVAKDAPLVALPKTFPIVMISHGSGGSANRLFWLVEHLVKNGFIAIAVNHPGNMIRDNSGDGMMRVWNRAPDLSFALDHVLKTSEFKNRLDVSRVGAVGHSAGGTTVLLLGGARLSKAKFKSPIPNCAGTKDPFYKKLCDQVKAADLNSYSKEAVEADYTDPRVTAVVSLDPGFAESFDANSLKNMKAKTLVLIADKVNEPENEIHSRDFLKLMPTPTSEVVPNSIHMTFLTACKTVRPEDDPEEKELCAKNEDKLRIQKEVSEKTLAFFNKVWSK